MLDTQRTTAVDNEVDRRPEVSKTEKNKTYNLPMITITLHLLGTQDKQFPCKVFLPQVPWLFTVSVGGSY